MIQLISISGRAACSVRIAGTTLAQSPSADNRRIQTRRGTAPCSYTCPAGVNPGGWISLVRAGKYDEAFRLHLQEAPLVGSLSRACYAPCEGAGTRTDMDRLRRRLPDWRDARMWLYGTALGATAARLAT